jgi:hypothetical protein
VRFLSYSKLRLKSFLEQAESVAESEFPYEDSKTALALVQTLFRQKLAQLEHFDEKSYEPVVKQECRLALEALHAYLPLLGFIVRSTNIRNAFEAFGPIRRLATSLLAQQEDKELAPTTHLLLSSEWDYSPFVYDAIPGLPDFLMIGLPAPESSNPLLLPLAGHELGHSLWKLNNLDTTLKPLVKEDVIKELRARRSDYNRLFGTKASPDEIITNLLELENWAPAPEWAQDQAQETFCDFVGLLLFGSSFLDAFAYLLSPAFGRRAQAYPPLKQRAANLAWAAAANAIEVPVAYVEMFDAEDSPMLSNKDRFLLLVADTTLNRLRDTLLEHARSLVDAAGLKLPSPEEVNGVYSSLERVVPAEGARALSRSSSPPGGHSTSQTSGERFRRSPDSANSFSENLLSRALRSSSSST